MKALHNKVNIIPIIAKADTLTQTELKKLKARVSKLIKYNINVVFKRLKLILM